MKNFRGFTLVELMIVVAIIGVLGLIAVSTITNSIPGYQLQKASRDMIERLRLARSMAIKFNRRVVVAFDETNGFYILDQGVTNKRIPPSGTISEYYGAGIKLGFPGRSDGVHFNVGSSGGTDAGDSIVFNTRGLTEKPDGTPGVMGYVYIQNIKGAGYRVGVTGLAADIRMDKCGSDGADCKLNP
jgi:prepilin-type N-terminal cleavage/methylation domain-containing protein